jgi:hypothetical protein
MPISSLQVALLFSLTTECSLQPSVREGQLLRSCFGDFSAGARAPFPLKCDQDITHVCLRCYIVERGGDLASKDERPTRPFQASLSATAERDRLQFAL